MTTHAAKLNVVSNVVRKDLCSGCGVCVGICPGNHLAMGDAPNGDLIAQWSNEPCPKNCGLCMEVCPFAEGVLNPRPLNIELYGPEIQHPDIRFHKDVGYYDRAFMGHSETNRPTSASGGLLTWTLETLLSSGEVDRVAVVVCEPDEIHGYRFVFKEACTIAEVRHGSGSIYHQVEISDILRRIATEPGLRWAITGVPCLASALRRAMRRLPKVGCSIRYLLSLACGMYQNRFYTELLIAAAGLVPGEVVTVKYRVGSASNFEFEAASRDGRIGERINYGGLPYYLGKNGFFRCNACNFCMDVFGENADACYMDAWLPEYRKDPHGTSLLLVRNPQLGRLIVNGMADNHLTMVETGIERILESQAGHVRRKRHLIAMRQGKRIDPSTQRVFSPADHHAWSAQRHTQRRSKEEWAKVGRHGGLLAFWGAMWDVTLLIKLEELYSKFSGRILRLAARLNK